MVEWWYRCDDQVHPVGLKLEHVLRSTPLCICLSPSAQ
jgi:hypothetical protein